MARLPFRGFLFLLFFFFSNLCYASITTLDDNILAQYSALSYRQCKDKCNESLKCESVKYFRRYKHCKLFTEQQESKPGFDVYSKPKAQRQEHSERYTECKGAEWDSKSTCIPISCLASPRVPGSVILGNDYKIGAAIKIQCMHVEDSQIITCTPNGTWTHVSLVCNCKTNNLYEFNVVADNLTHIFTEIRCERNVTVVVQNEYQTCSYLTGSWVKPGSSCCETVNRPWITIFVFKTDSWLGALTVWNYASAIHGTHFTRSSIIDNWEAVNITRVRLEIFKDNKIVGYMVFNGCDSNKLDWFSQERLINSSWDDLQYGSVLGELSIQGSNVGNRRFFVSKSHVGEDSCMRDNGWFVSTGNYYNCAENSDRIKKRVLYSPYNTASTFHEMSQADEFVISIKKEN